MTHAPTRGRIVFTVTPALYVAHVTAELIVAVARLLTGGRVQKHQRPSIPARVNLTEKKKTHVPSVPLLKQKPTQNPI